MLSAKSTDTGPYVGTTLPTSGYRLATAAPHTPVSGSTATIENVELTPNSGCRSWLHSEPVKIRLMAINVNKVADFMVFEDDSIFFAFTSILLFHCLRILGS